VRIRRRVRLINRGGTPVPYATHGQDFMGERNTVDRLNRERDAS